VIHQGKSGVQDVPLSLYSGGSLIWSGFAPPSLDVFPSAWASSTTPAPGVRRKGLRMGMAQQTID
jgi:hypothetical protein